MNVHFYVEGIIRWILSLRKQIPFPLLLNIQIFLSSTQVIKFQTANWADCVRNTNSICIGNSRSSDVTLCKEFSSAPLQVFVRHCEAMV